MYDVPTLLPPSLAVGRPCSVVGRRSGVASCTAICDVPENGRNGSVTSSACIGDAGDQLSVEAQKRFDYAAIFYPLARCL
ncbi:hypothetical protein [Paractinoplanes maris]|uniref:hypothetical protein n=1 Tax=Paractinoplanes maris TaxID=1734446 RepID=UPI002021F15F|nr:hypothetical protein [Actinoplanes maris]